MFTNGPTVLLSVTICDAKMTLEPTLLLFLLDACNAQNRGDQDCMSMCEREACDDGPLSRVNSHDIISTVTGDGNVGDDKREGKTTLPPRWSRMMALLIQTLKATSLTVLKRLRLMDYPHIRCSLIPHLGTDPFHVATHSALGRCVCFEA